VRLLPAARGPRGAPYRVALVCLGNICRSPIAEVVLTDRLAKAGLADRVRVRSAGTGGWHVGDPMDRRAARTLSDAGYDPTRHRAQQLDASWYDDHDVLLVMDDDNLRDVRALAPHPEDADRVLMFRDFDPALDGTDGSDGTSSDRDVADPYFGGDDGFLRVLAVVERTADRLTTELGTHVEAVSGRAD
jgi:protein-tyrosine phosphatase